MNSKSIRWLLILSIVLGGLWFAQNKYISRNLINNSGIVKFDPEGSSSEVKRITIVKNDDTIGMTQKDGIWFLETDKPLGEDRAIQADADKLAKILDGINVEVVSQNESRQSELGLDESANTINYYKENETSPFLVIRFSNLDGKNFKLGDKVNVYSWDNSTVGVLNMTKETWLEPTPMPTEPVSPVPQSNSSVE